MSSDQISRSRLAPEYVLLGFLFAGTGHGYELHRRLSDEFGSIWHTSQSQTYNILSRLEEKGFISSSLVQQEKLPPRQQLQITDSGKQRFIAWLNRPTISSVHAIRVEFVTRLYFMQLYNPAGTQEMIRVQIEGVEMSINQLLERLNKLPDQQVFNRIALELRVELLRSVVLWLKDCHKLFSTNKGTSHGYE